MDHNKFKTLKKKVEYVLDEIEETRNSDVELTVNLWEIFYEDEIMDAIRMLTVKSTVYDFFRWVLKKLPSHKDIARVRAIIQNEELRFLPTKKEIFIKRGIEESLWYEMTRPRQSTLFY